MPNSPVCDFLPYIFRSFTTNINMNFAPYPYEYFSDYIKIDRKNIKANKIK